MELKSFCRHRHLLLDASLNLFLQPNRLFHKGRFLKISSTFIMRFKPQFLFISCVCGPAMVRLVSHHCFTVESWVRSQAIPRVICGRRISTGTGFFLLSAWVFLYRYQYCIRLFNSSIADATCVILAFVRVVKSTVNPVHVFDCRDCVRVATVCNT